jgi:hypothetical protein
MVSFAENRHEFAYYWRQQQIEERIAREVERILEDCNLQIEEEVLLEVASRLGSGEGR